MKVLRFYKYHGLGNDFLIFNGSGRYLPDRNTITYLCDRHFGVGADGIILAEKSNVADARMIIFNKDGTRPEMCGNGIRCLVAHLIRSGISKNPLSIETDAGIKECNWYRDIDQKIRVQVDMGTIEEGPMFVVRTSFGDFEGKVLSAGNPHFVIEDEVDDQTLEIAGREISTNRLFKNGTNVEFIKKIDNNLICKVYERGVGPTLACGTGACASAYYAIKKGLFSDEDIVNVCLPGGTLKISLESRSGRIIMDGPSEFVFRGEIVLNDHRWAM